MEKEKYVVIKELPDADVGTVVTWDEENNAYTYEKSGFISPFDKTFLTEDQVTQSPEFFCKASHYPEYYSYKYPVFSREEILNLVNDCFPNKRFSGEFEISGSRELHKFKEKLREFGKEKAKDIIAKNKDYE